MTTYETLDGSWSGSSKEMARVASVRDKVTYQNNIGALWSEAQLETLGFKVVPFVAPPEPTLEELKTSKTFSIKAEAGRRITQIIPEWKQRNLTAQASQLAEKGRFNWSTSEASSWDAGVALWEQVKIVRDKSNVLENSLEEMSLEELKTFDVSLDGVWV